MLAESEWNSLGCRKMEAKATQGLEAGMDGAKLEEGLA